MVRARIDAISIAIANAGAQTRRTALKQVAGGSLAALAAASGIGSGEDAAAKSRCRKSCRRENSRKKRRNCRRRCGQGGHGQILVQTGSAKLARFGADNCAQLGTCVDLVLGEISGAPVTDGTFTGAMTGVNIRIEGNFLVVDFAGTLIAFESDTAASIGAALTLVMRQEIKEAGELSPFSFSGTFVLAGGAGRFAGATGGGTITGEGIRPYGGAEGTVDSFRMEGHYQLKGKK